MYEWMGRAHAALARGRRSAHAALAREGGQGTVEYVGLILLLAVILAGVVKASSGFNDEEIAKTVVGKLKQAIEDVGS